MTKQFLDPEGIIRSLRSAFERHGDLNISTKRLLGIVSQLPSGALYIIHDKDRISFYEKTDSGKNIFLNDLTYYIPLLGSVIFWSFCAPLTRHLLMDLILLNGMSNSTNYLIFCSISQRAV